MAPSGPRWYEPVTATVTRLPSRRRNETVCSVSDFTDANAAVAGQPVRP